MSDLIRVIDLEVHTYIGVPEEERRNPQRLLVSFELSVDSFTHAASTDNIAWTIDYANVARHIQQVAARRSRKLLETLAEEIAVDLLNAFPIRKVTLEIKKFILHDAQYVSVRIERSAV
jgi:dihydroneopterin aldolase